MKRQPLYTVDCGTNLPADLAHLVEWIDAPHVTKIRIHNRKKNRYFYKRSGYHYQVAPCHVFTTPEAAEPLRLKIQGIYDAQRANRDAWLRAEEEQAIKTFTDIAEQFPKYPDFKRWSLETSENALGVTTEMILHLTPEEEEILDLESGYPFPVFTHYGEDFLPFGIEKEDDYFLTELKSMLAKLTTEQ